MFPCKIFTKNRRQKNIINVTLICRIFAKMFLSAKIGISPQFRDFKKNPHIREYRKKTLFPRYPKLFPGAPLNRLLEDLIWSSSFFAPIIFSRLMDDGFVPGTVDGLLVGLKAEEHQRAADLH
jgi:hypothetical protein